MSDSPWSIGWAKAREQGEPPAETPAPEAAPAKTWAPALDPDSPALEGLSQETLDAILGAVTPEQITAFVSVLTDQPQKVEKIRQLLMQRGVPGFEVGGKRDTQYRRMRTIRDAAVISGYPVATSNQGYWLGDWEDVYETAERAEKFAHGALKRARVLKQQATLMRARA